MKVRVRAREKKKSKKRIMIFYHHPQHIYNVLLECYSHVREKTNDVYLDTFAYFDWKVRVAFVAFVAHIALVASL